MSDQIDNILHIVMAVRSGPWMDPMTWNTQTVPTRNDNVVIPNGLTISTPEKNKIPPYRSLTIKRSGTLEMSGSSLAS